MSSVSKVRESRKRLWQGWRRITRPAWLGFVRQRTAALSTEWGHDRGDPIDRVYIESFLKQHRHDIRGRVLEVRESMYTRQFGTQVEQSLVLDLDSKNPRATFVCDLAHADCVPDDAIDCFVCTQTLQFVYEPRAALAHVYRFLKPGGVVLATVPGISRTDRALADVDYWRFGVAACARLFGDCFGASNTTVRAYGNVLTAAGFLTGMARQELNAAAWRVHDPLFPVIVAVRAVKPGEAR